MSAIRMESDIIEHRLPNAGTARATLVRLTKNVHERLHRQPSFVQLMSQTLTLRDYIRLLGRLHGFHGAFETALRLASNVVSDIDLVAREKTRLLSSDLISLGMSRDEIERTEQCRHVRPFQSQDQIVGALYVLEGAGLGGKVIAGKLNYLLGDVVPAGREFFLGRPAPDPLPWAKFCDALERQATTGRLATIANSALHTFGAFESWMNEGEHLV